MNDSLAELMDRVAAFPVQSREWNFEQHDWEKGCYVNGLLAANRQEEQAQRLIDRAIETQTSRGCLDYGSLGDTPYGWEPKWSSEDMGPEDIVPANPTVMGHGVLERYDETGEERYLEAATRHFEYLQSLDRTSNGGIPIATDTTVLIIDTLYHNCRFFSLYGAYADSAEAFDEAVRQFKAHANRLYDSHTGLYRQGWKEVPNTFTQGAFWGRGMGWFTTSLADTLQYLPSDHHNREYLEELFTEVCEVLLEYQDSSGFWHNIIDYGDAPLETSSTLMFTYSFKRGIEMGLLPSDPYEQVAKQAIEVTKGVVDPDGRVRRVSSVPGGPGSPLKPQLLGQGWFLMAASQFQ